jgi:hypothetical protein
MKNNCFIYFALALCIILPAAIPALAQVKPAGASWVTLFNGKDLSGWETYLRPSESAPDQKAIGLNKDPHGVFKAENGMLHISGQDWGGIFTQQSYSNYHLRYQVKFGPKKWSPRENAVADGGLLYHCSLPYDFGSKCWMRSVEMQIQETDIGDYHNVGAGIPQIPFSRSNDEEVPVDQYDPFAPLKPTKNRVFRSGNFESASDQWTTGELITRGADAVFIVNGFVVNRVYNLYRDDLQQQTTSGQLQFQSEGAEHFLRNIELRPVSFGQTGTPKLIASKYELQVSTQETHHIEIQNQGDAVELIAVELMGKDLEQFSLKLPTFPLVVKKGDKLTIPVSAKAGSASGNLVKFRLETVLGPISDFAVNLKIK